MKTTVTTDENGYHSTKVKFDPYQDDEASHTEHLTVKFAGDWTLTVYPDGIASVDAPSGASWLLALTSPPDDHGAMWVIDYEETSGAAVQR